MGSGASQAVARVQARRHGSEERSRSGGAEAHTRDLQGGAAIRRRASYWCHQCQVSVSRLADGDVCPICREGFIQESTSVAMLAQAARWLATGSGAALSTEARIARLLDDLHVHLEMVEGLQASMRHAMDRAEEAAARPQLDPAPQHVLDAIKGVQLDSQALQSMRQSAQCVICCADFETGERLSCLPGCGHVFHGLCVEQWLKRAANCPICRNDLVLAVRTMNATDSTAHLEEVSVASCSEHVSPPVPQTPASNTPVANVTGANVAIQDGSSQSTALQLPQQALRRSGLAVRRPATSSVLMGAGSAISIPTRATTVHVERAPTLNRAGTTNWSLPRLRW